MKTSTAEKHTASLYIWTFLVVGASFNAGIQFFKGIDEFFITSQKPIGRCRLYSPQAF
jgi:hypothetical protein